MTTPKYNVTNSRDIQKVFIDRYEVLLQENPKTQRRRKKSKLTLRKKKSSGRVHWVPVLEVSPGLLSVVKMKVLKQFLDRAVEDKLKVVMTRIQEAINIAEDNMRPDDWEFDVGRYTSMSDDDDDEVQPCDTDGFLQLDSSDDDDTAKPAEAWHARLSLPDIPIQSRPAPLTLFGGQANIEFSDAINKRHSDVLVDEHIAKWKSNKKRRGNPKVGRFVPYTLSASPGAHPTITWPTLEVKTSKVSAYAGLGVFAKDSLPVGSMIPVMGARDAEVCNNMYLKRTQDGSVINGDPHINPYNGIGSHGASIALMVNEPSRGKPNCLFVNKTDCLITNKRIRAGSELTVHYGDGYRRVNYCVSDDDTWYESLNDRFFPPMDPDLAAFANNL